MFGIGPVEFAVVLIVALLVMGPKKLPQLARTLGKGMAEFRRASTDLKRSFDMDLHSHEIPDPPGPAQAGSPQSPAPPGSALAEIEGGEPSADQEPSADREPSANREPSADEEPLASNNHEPSAMKAPPGLEEGTAETSAKAVPIKEERAVAATSKPATETPGD